MQALDGEYYLVKSDILARTMQFSSSKDALVNVTTLSVERVKEIQALNRAGKKAAATVKTAAVKVATATVAASAAGRAAAPIAAAVREMPTVRRRALRGRTAAARAIRSNGPKRDGRGCVCR